ncbi:arabinogalactan endo-1,4-beta-galactosidase [Aliifodinibius salipaludis]|uniref:Arabinogalactan endo-beta-1,4-galactanase n=1 Tax=Fodinibius salipaludis TaxID=2032627 RepID=A0A2A2GFD9_9BACT|nr:glycosyl hydrolase 53 family protein [Aliifodinibius salipaludis]PAU95599.1 arabinogalactan endo-1,4-beta-galactosidase [Aliifodinibius salipaludis]
MTQKYIFLIILSLSILSCQDNSPTNGDSDGNDDHGSTPEQEETSGDFVMGADLSYVNQILDKGGTYRDSGTVENPYKIFSDYGTDVARFRLWHDPEWTANVYEGEDNPMYNDLADVKRAIRQAKKHGMGVNLDFHYSDTWADPDHQNIPEAWRDITDLEKLKDVVYNYTKETLQHLEGEGLMPEYVQIGNETNCGLMYSNAPQDFPSLNVCDGHWSNTGEVINSGIEAVREVSSSSDVDTKIILHIAQPENVSWWFDNLTTTGNVTDFDIIGFSYYTPWSDVSLNQISDHVSDFRDAFDKEVMIVETAYPWTMDYADDYNNQFGSNALVDGYPATKEGQRDFMIDLTKEVMGGGGSGLMYWEPAWITSNMKDQWGTGSSWENNTLFDFEGNVHQGIEYINYDYESN